MAIRKIRVNDDPILRKKSRDVTEFDERLFTLLDDMRETLAKSDGIGLAAVQVGVLRRAVVVDLGDGVKELINPSIVESSGEQRESEGCLSLPHKYGITVRPKTVTVRAQNRNGNWCLYKGTDLAARCYCHELDHLDGKLYTDVLAPGEKVYFSKDN
ncbi:MAG: peptide deformylase [Oscillospiraceae bacterium]|nr:peptide deformylase [Oscillospiraceae bacterium]